jgi:twitching motility two-component system response regulator PilH
MPKRVLVVDDSALDQHAMSRPLTRSGYVVDIASNGKEALTQLGRQTYDVLLLDVIMPDQNGFQLCRQLRRDARYKHMPIIMVTSKDEPADRFWGMKQGATEYITKPFAEDHLVSVVTRYA